MIHKRKMAFLTLLPLFTTIAHPRIHFGLSRRVARSLCCLSCMVFSVFVFFRLAPPFFYCLTATAATQQPLLLPSLPHLQLVLVLLHRICKSTRALLLCMASSRSLRLHGLPAPPSPGSIQRRLTLACRPPLSSLLWLVDVAFESPKNVRLETQVPMRE